MSWCWGEGDTIMFTLDTIIMCPDCMVSPVCQSKSVGQQGPSGEEMHHGKAHSGDDGKQQDTWKVRLSEDFILSYP